MINCIFTKNDKRLPDVFASLNPHIPGVRLVYGVPDGEDLKVRKFGIECVDDVNEGIAVIDKFIPGLKDDVLYTYPCYYAATADREMIFQRHGSTIYAFGFNGGGYKYMPYHGRRIYNLVIGNLEEANKYAKKTA